MNAILLPSLPSVLSLVLSMVLALALDYCLAEPRRWHPLAGFGWLANQWERWANPQQQTKDSTAPKKSGSLLLGGLGVLLLIITPAVIAAWWLSLASNVSPLLHILLGIGILYLTLGSRSLEQHTQAVQQSLEAGHLDQARQQVGLIVSRDTDALNSQQITRATLESLLENGNDAVIAPLFWFLLAGPVGALVYRLVNTLDAMWGYRNARFIYFGRAAARLDDLMNWLPARICCLLYALAGNAREGLSCWQRQAATMASPNAGPVMCCGAGALNLNLGGKASYHGRWVSRPQFGTDTAPVPGDIKRAIQLLRRAIVILLLMVLAVMSAAVPLLSLLDLPVSLASSETPVLLKVLVSLQIPVSLEVVRV